MRSTWRRIATPMTLLLLLGLLAFGLWWGWRELTAPPKSTPAEPCVTQSASVLTTAQVTVKVYNGGTAAGRASQVSEQLAGKGFVVDDPANTSEQVATTIIVGSTAEDPAVLLVSGFFTDSQIRADSRTDGTVDVLVGDNFPGFRDDAPVQVEVPGGTVCVPASSSTPEAAA
ncbi:hypothetical protein GCM10009785_12710 [Brooklawnia cerclae]|uniref:LytR/CpsA/Psr regulator C-terminal domain-containing protein n=1 Tax=Brooklawnia cerclae TaxID=349934 RepID=A0ABX0SP50_9ACTN|nr:hypothetical protein [Brooklawnia cerclae]